MAGNRRGRDHTDRHNRVEFTANKEDDQPDRQTKRRMHPRRDINDAMEFWQLAMDKDGITRQTSHNTAAPPTQAA